jgi:hypothetical protein
MPKAALPSAAAQRFVFCFAHQSPANMHNLLPVAREAQERGLLGGIVSGARSLEPLREFSGRVPMVTGQSLISLLSMRERRSIAREAMQAVREMSRLVSRCETRLRVRLLKNAGMVLDEIVRSLATARAFQRLFQAWSPACVISTSDLFPFEFQFARQAQACGIPSVVIQHGTPDDCWWPFQADHFVAWGEVFREQMLALGAPASRLTVGGMPASDAVFQRAQTLRQGQDSSNTVHKPPVCLILSHSHGRAFEPDSFQQLKAFLPEVIASTPDISWKVKLHPAEDDSFYRELGDATFRRLEIYPRSTTLTDAVSNADVATTLFSASGLDAMIRGCPVIVTALSARSKELAWWPDVGGGVFAHTPDEFRQHLMDLVAIPERRSSQLERQRDFVRRSFANPGRASQAIVNFMTSLQEEPRGVLRQRITA